MTIQLSYRTKDASRLLFEESEQSRLCDRLLREVSENIPFCESETPEGMERIRFAVLKLVHQHPKNEEIAFNHAKMDWRDLFMAAGFGHSATEHEVWFDKLRKTGGQHGGEEIRR